MIQRRIVRLLTIAALAGAGFPLASPVAFCQTSTGFIVGVVEDQSGSVVPGASLTLTGPGTGFTRATIADHEGSYSFRQVPPGRYRLTAEMSGFKRYVQEPIAVRATA